jgi:hypothetical protein
MNADIFALLKANQLPEPTQTTLSVLSLWRLAVYYLIFFTLHPKKLVSHYDDAQGQYLCLGPECPACAAGIRQTEHIYLPVWDAQSRRVAVLKFDTRLDGPAGKILAFLKAYRDRLADVVAAVECQGGGAFTITAHEPLPETDRGALACEAFCQGLEAGTISLDSCVKRLPAAEIARLASVSRRSARVVGGLVAPTPAKPAPGVAGGPVPPAPEPKAVSP